ncbi:MAG: hypothetical protein V1820_01280 [archaeon]
MTSQTPFGDLLANWHDVNTSGFKGAGRGYLKFHCTWGPTEELEDQGNSSNPVIAFVNKVVDFIAGSSPAAPEAEPVEEHRNYLVDGSMKFEFREVIPPGGKTDCFYIVPTIEQHPKIRTADTDLELPNDVLQRPGVLAPFQTYLDALVDGDPAVGGVFSSPVKLGKSQVVKGPNIPLGEIPYKSEFRRYQFTGDCFAGELYLPKTIETKNIPPILGISVSAEKLASEAQRKILVPGIFDALIRFGDGVLLNLEKLYLSEPVINAAYAQIAEAEKIAEAI